MCPTLVCLLSAEQIGPIEQSVRFFVSIGLSSDSDSLIDDKQLEQSTAASAAVAPFFVEILFNEVSCSSRREQLID